MKNIIIKATLTCLLLFMASFSSAQTSVFDKYVYYTNEVNKDMFGYLNTSLYLGGKELKQKGIRYQRNYLLSKIAAIPVHNSHQINILLDGSFRLGLGVGTETFNSPPAHFPKRTKFYVGNIDFFSMNITPEYTYVFKNGFAITTRLGLNILNIGATLAMSEGGSLKDNAIGSVNLIPLAFNPSIYFDFGKSGLGFGLYSNPSNLLSYVYAPKGLYSDENVGIQMWDSIIEKFEIQFIFVL